MKLYPNQNRAINRRCNEFIEKINEDTARIKDQQEGNPDFPHILSSICARINDVRENHLINVARREDALPEIYADNQDLLLSASIGQLRKPIETYVNPDGDSVGADDARQMLAYGIQQLENEASNQLKIIYLDWQEQVSKLTPTLAE